MNEILVEMEQFARKNNIPVVLPDTREYLVNLIKEKQPKRILEIGMAIGFSGANMLGACADSEIVELEASTPNIELALGNYKRLGLLDRVTIIEGDCMKTLPELVRRGEKFDFIFLDGPKGKYVDMIDLIKPLMSEGCIWVSDNVLFRGMVQDGQEITSKRFEVTVESLRNFINTLQNDKELVTEILHIGDGLSIVERIK